MCGPIWSLAILQSGNLFFFILGNFLLPEPVLPSPYPSDLNLSLQVLGELLLAIATLHRIGIVHRDIKVRGHCVSQYPAYSPVLRRLISALVSTAGQYPADSCKEVPTSSASAAAVDRLRFCIGPSITAKSGVETQYSRSEICGAGE